MDRATLTHENILSNYQLRTWIFFVVDKKLESWKAPVDFHFQWACLVNVSIQTILNTRPLPHPLSFRALFVNHKIPRGR